MRVGILGSMVWDRIDHPDAATVERWGGISYSLAAASARLPAGWSLRPLVKVGQDLADEARTFLDSLPGLDDRSGIVVVPEKNNRVHLQYHGRHDRTETLSGGVPGWEWDELDPLLDGIDALYLNLISGFEIGLSTATRLRPALDAPLYVDLHSLLLGATDGGTRVPRPLANREEWLAAFDVVQVNEAELALVAAGDDPLEIAGATIRDHRGALLVTRGPHGATWYAAEDAPRPWIGPGGSAGSGTVPSNPVRSGTIPADQPGDGGDPTGCGDVWGVTCFLALLQGRKLSEAVAVANGAAALNLLHRGAEGLHHLLREPT